MLLLHGCQLSESLYKNTSSEGAVLLKPTATQLSPPLLNYQPAIDFQRSYYRPQPFSLGLDHHEQKLRLVNFINMFIIPMTLYHRNFIEFLCVEKKIFWKTVFSIKGTNHHQDSSPHNPHSLHESTCDTCTVAIAGLFLHHLRSSRSRHSIYQKIWYYEGQFSAFY